MAKGPSHARWHFGRHSHGRTLPTELQRAIGHGVLDTRDEVAERALGARLPTQTANQVSWFQRSPAVSLELVRRAGVPPSAPILDVGAGASTLVDALLAEGFGDVTLLDVSETALEIAHRRLGGTRQVRYVVGDVTRWKPSRQYALWHDRATFHFLVDDEARSALGHALGPGGMAILATFALDGPERCSGLPVRRYSAATLAAVLSDVLSPIESRDEVHVTPSGTKQSFVYELLERLPPAE